MRFIETNTSAENISDYTTAYKRANKFEGTIYGIRVYATQRGTLEYGILYSDKEV